MSLGLYVHFPYCLQQCSYCDFATALQQDSHEALSYVETLVQEIEFRASGVTPKKISTIYFGGGTPSLLEPSSIVKLFDAFSRNGFLLDDCEEITLEINPDTVSKEKLRAFLELGVNRFSVGVQTFDDNLLKAVGRLHSSAQTRSTLELLAHENVNFSVDILYSLPGQTLAQVEADLREALTYGPRHVSPYILTLPQKHPLQTGRASDEEQIHMFHALANKLEAEGFERYEISNFSRPGFASKHNLAAWHGLPYWGIGMSSHSYLPNENWGVRFSNPPKVSAYQKQVLDLAQSQNPYAKLPPHQVENLKKHEALTDFCHTHLRLKTGLPKNKLAARFGDACLDQVTSRLMPYVKSGQITLDRK